jgi:hypothetical protein
MPDKPIAFTRLSGSRRRIRTAKEAVMFKEFDHHIAWTDIMKSEHGFVGLIEYQPKRSGAEVNVLWVVGAKCICATEAEILADNMLQEISDIRPDGSVVYSDGVAL